MPRPIPPNRVGLVGDVGADREIVAVPDRVEQAAVIAARARYARQTLRARLDQRFARLTQPCHGLGDVQVSTARPIDDRDEQRIIEAGPPRRDIGGLAGRCGGGIARRDTQHAGRGRSIIRADHTRLKRQGDGEQQKDALAKHASQMALRPIWVHRNIVAICNSGTLGARNYKLFPCFALSLLGRKYTPTSSPDTPDVIPAPGSPRPPRGCRRAPR